MKRSIAYTSTRTWDQVDADGTNIGIYKFSSFKVHCQTNSRPNSDQQINEVEQFEDISCLESDVKSSLPFKVDIIWFALWTKKKKSSRTGFLCNNEIISFTKCRNLIRTKIAREFSPQWTEYTCSVLFAANDDCWVTTLTPNSNGEPMGFRDLVIEKYVLMRQDHFKFKLLFIMLGHATYELPIWKAISSIDLIIIEQPDIVIGMALEYEYFISFEYWS